MHAANSYLSSIGKLASGSILSESERTALGFRLRDDARDYYQSALTSFVDGIRSLSHGFFTWSTVKFYYSVFYALRCRLALSGECIFYDGSKPRYITTASGAKVSSLKGTTHKCVLSRFAASFPNDFFLSQDIGTEKPLQWLMERREEVNYASSRFSEPGSPDFLSFAARTEIRQMLGAYSADNLYVHDPDHAMVAFPFRLIKDLRERLRVSNVEPLVQLETDFLVASTRDRAGIVTALSSLIC